MRETTGVGVIVLLVVYVWCMNHQGKEIQEEVAKAQKRAASVAMPTVAPAYQPPPGFTGWQEKATGTPQQMARD
jgi:hypothetical protein